MSVHHQMINRPAAIQHAYTTPGATMWPSSQTQAYTASSQSSKSYPLSTYSRSDQLRIRIHENHLSYLSRDETPSKFELRSKIEALITEYLSLIPHNHKFSFKEIGDCLNKTIKKPDFDPQRTISAFEAIEKYATNLLNFPWRHEFRTIFAFSGFFYRTIECNLVNYQKIFELLGFSYDSSSKIYKLLDIPIDPDRVSKISLECLVAIVECKIMLNIHNLIKTKFSDISWNDIYSIRSDYVCNTENAVKLICDLKTTGKLIDLDLPDYSVKTFTKLDLLSPANNSNINKTILDNSTNTNSFGSHVSYLESNLDSIDFIEGPSENIESSSGVSPSHGSTAFNSLGSDKKVSLSSNPFHDNFSLRKSTNKSTEKPTTINGITNSSLMSNQAATNFASINSNINTTDDKSSKNYRFNHVDPVLLAEINQFEVNKNPFVPTSRNAFPSDQRKALKHPIIENKTVDRVGQLQIVNCIARNAKLEPQPYPMENANSNASSKAPMKVTVSSLYAPAIQPNSVNISDHTGLTPKTWPCNSCTYKNRIDLDVCEMCHRSRTQGNESTPLVSGGRECSRCTLVNGKEAKLCKACGTSLADSPTYI